jgi:peptide/nickel transport system permease protein
MTSYIIRRILYGVVLIFLSTTLSFAILKAAPGKPIAFDNPRVSPATIEQEMRRFGYDQPAWRQYINWLGVSRLLGMGMWRERTLPDKTKEWFYEEQSPAGLLQGNFGESSKYSQSVSKVLWPRLQATLLLNIATLGLTWLVAIPLGIYAAVHYQKIGDRVVSLFSFVGMSLPGFFMALLLLWIFALEFQWLPPGGLYSIDYASFPWWQKILDTLWHLIVPVTVLTMLSLASLQRVCRGNMLEVLRQQYVTTARAKGLAENVVVYRHALRNAINPLVTILGFEFAALFGGAALLENVINFPGMGQLLLEALRSQDRDVVMAVFLLGSIMLVLGNLLAELLLAWIDPRVTLN